MKSQCATPTKGAIFFYHIRKETASQKKQMIMYL